MSDTDHDELINTLMANMSEAWGSGEGAAESIVIDYVQALEKRVTALGGHLEPYDGGQTAALGEFYALARRHVTTEDLDAWNDMVDAWDRWVQAKEDAQ